MTCPAVGLAMKPVGKPDAGNRHVRFDERGEETEPWRGLRHRHLAKAAGNSYPHAYRHRASLRLYRTAPCYPRSCDAKLRR